MFYSKLFADIFYLIEVIRNGFEFFSCEGFNIYLTLNSVNLNFFAEKHGKNSRDAHFSNISKFIRIQSLKTRLTSSKDIADAIIQRQKMANENNQDKNSRVEVHVAVLDLNEAKAIHDKHSNYNFINISN